MFLIYQSISENIHQAFCLGLKDESEVTDKMSMPVSLASAESHLKSSKRPISFVSIEIQTADKREVAKKKRESNTLYFEQSG